MIIFAKICLLRKVILISILCVLSGGCGAKYGQVNEETKLSLRQNFYQGKAVLDCGLACAGRFGYNRLEMKALFDSQQWNDLADRVLSIGLEKDQAWYYLGRSAENLNHLEAAKTYYIKALASAFKCGNNCDGLVFPRDINIRLRGLAYSQHTAVADTEELTIDGVWKNEKGLPFQISKGKMYLLVSTSNGVPAGALIAKEIIPKSAGKFSCKIESYNEKNRVLDFGDGELRIASEETIDLESFPNPKTSFAGAKNVLTKSRITNETRYSQELAAMKQETTKSASSAERKPSKIESTKNGLEIREDLPSIVKRVAPSTVTIRSYKADGKTVTQGSGFFINKEGEVITCHHVLSGSVRAEVITASGNKYSLHKIITTNPEADIALFSLNSLKSKMPYLTVSASIPQIGERIGVIGTPEGLAQTVTDGIVSGVREVSGMGRTIQITAPLSPGSSGSPVVNMKGEVIGMAVGVKKTGQALNFAIPGETVLKAVKLPANASYATESLKMGEQFKKIASRNSVFKISSGMEATKLLIIWQCSESASGFYHIWNFEMNHEVKSNSAFEIKAPDDKAPKVCDKIGLFVTNNGPGSIDIASIAD